MASSCFHVSLRSRYLTRILTKWSVQVSHESSYSPSRLKELFQPTKRAMLLERTRLGELSTKELNSKTMIAYRDHWYSLRRSRTVMATSLESSSGSLFTISRLSKLFLKFAWTSQTWLLDTKSRMSMLLLALKSLKSTKTLTVSDSRFHSTWSTSSEPKSLSTQLGGTTQMAAKWLLHTLAVKSLSSRCQSCRILPLRICKLVWCQ